MESSRFGGHDDGCAWCLQQLGRFIGPNDRVVGFQHIDERRDIDNPCDDDDLDEHDLDQHDTTSTSSTVLATTTTIATEAQVKADYLTLYDAYWTCLRTPQSCDPAALTASVGPARAALTKTVDDLVNGGLFAGADDPGYVVVESVELSGPTTAVVSSCWWDTGVLYGPPAKAGGDPVVVNNLQVTSRFDTTMELEGGRWLTSEEKRTERVEGQNKCPPEG